jgi:4-nitrophenyl phosphatase
MNRTQTGLKIIQTILLDMDGVLWRGTEPIVDLQQLFARIEDLGLKSYCVTNNSARTLEYYLKKLADLGVQLSPEQIITSAEATAAHLLELFPSGGAVYIVGEPGLVDTLGKYGFQDIAEGRNSTPLAVIAGLDRELTYQKISTAAAFIREGAVFLGTNPDQTIPVQGGIAPGAGTVIGAIEIASGLKAELIGKPARRQFLIALERSRALPDQSLMVGDRLNTDILGAQSHGLWSALVLSGVTSPGEAADWRPVPDIIAGDVMEVIDRLAHEKR